MYLDHSRVHAVTAEEAAPVNPYPGGYGRKIPTRYKIRLDDNRTRRVYVAQFSNAGSAWVLVNGERLFLNSDTEHALQDLSVGTAELKPPKLPVIFRAERSGAHKGVVTAVFPTLDENNGLFTVYAHMGQHSAGSRGWYHTTRAATPAEYASLLSELKQIYSNPSDPERVELVIYKRWPN